MDVATQITSIVEAAYTWGTTVIVIFTAAVLAVSLLAYLFSRT